jgi:Zn-dependent protease
MSWSWRIGTVGGIPIYVHATFLVLVGFIFLADWNRGHDLSAALGGLLFITAVFATVVLHELGHALTAKRFGIGTRDITLLPIGGVARLERMPSVPRQELWVALAGPAVNLAIAGIAYGTLSLVTQATPGLTVSAGQGGVLARFIAVNLMLAGFNLVPAFPMDGGRALRALLAERMDYVRATHAAARLGQGLALLFGFIGLFSNPFLVFIALFVWVGASSESTMVDVRAALAGVPVSHAMITDFHRLDPDDTLEHAVDLVLAGSQRDFPVVSQGRVVGVLTREALVAGLARGGDPTARVSEVMTREVVTVDAAEMLEPAFQRLQTFGSGLLAVLRGRELVGILTLENVGELVMFRGVFPAVNRVAHGPV